MSDLWSNVIATHLQQANVLQPRLPTRFEPAAPLAAQPWEEMTGAVAAQPRAVEAPRTLEVGPQAPKQSSYQPGEAWRPNEPAVSIELPRPIVPGQPRPIMPTFFTPTSTQAQGEHRETLAATARTGEHEATHGIVVAPAIRSSVEATSVPRETTAQLSTTVINPPPRIRSTIEQPAAEAAPTVNVTIGRIDVRVTSAAPALQPARRTSNVMSLEDYLQQRSREAHR
jgi:hypothetical protein